MKYIVIDASKGGSDPGVTGSGIVEKDYTYLISKYIYDRLNEEGIKAYLTREGDYDLSVEERVRLIKDKFGSSSDVIVVSNELKDVGSGIDIIYALRNEDYLAEEIVEFLSNGNFNINEFYQLRDENNPSLDKEEIIRDTANNETIIVRYGNVNDYNDSLEIKNRWSQMAEAVVQGIISHTGGIINSSGYYTVVAGDSLYAIARKYNTTVDAIKSLNNLTSNVLSIGQLLKIPSNEVSNNYVTYVVVSGDSLYAIAKKYNTTVDGIKSLNNLTSNVLSVGQLLKIPSSKVSNDYITYVVVSGDSLYAIARKYNTTVDEIKTLNNLTSNVLSIGQILKIPSSKVSNDYITYVVVSGDSLYAIARKYNTTVDEIKILNNLTSNSLSIGQTLKIPV